MTRLVDIQLDEAALPPPTPEIEQERRVAIFDLLEANSFALPDGAPDGPYRLHLGVVEGRLRFDVATEAGAPAAQFDLSLSAFRQVVKDYFQICESYFGAVRSLPPAEIEALDQARREIHGEGARMLGERLEGKVSVDADTARRLFTLVCVLQSE